MAKIVKVELHSCDSDKKSNCCIVTYESGIARKFGYIYLENHGGLPATVVTFIGNGFCTNDETVNGVRIITYEEIKPEPAETPEKAFIMETEIKEVRVSTFSDYKQILVSVTYKSGVEEEFCFDSSDEFPENILDFIEHAHRKGECSICTDYRNKSAFINEDAEIKSIDTVQNISDNKISVSVFFKSKDIKNFYVSSINELPDMILEFMRTAHKRTYSYLVLVYELFEELPDDTPETAPAEDYCTLPDKIHAELPDLKAPYVLSYKMYVDEFSVITRSVDIFRYSLDNAKYKAISVFLRVIEYAEKFFEGHFAELTCSNEDTVYGLFLDDSGGCYWKVIPKPEPLPLSDYEDILSDPELPF